MRRRSLRFLLLSTALLLFYCIAVIGRGQLFSVKALDLAIRNGLVGEEVNENRAPEMPQSSSNELGDSDSCGPAKKIVFMKTHKCASSTIENILYRYALENDWNLVMPLRGSYLSYKELFNHTTVTSTPWGRLNLHLFALHNRWNLPEVKKLMGDDLRVFTIVRDPVNLFESLFGYMMMHLHYGVSIQELARFIKDPNKKNLTDSRSFGLYGRNQMSWDLGTPPEYFDDEVKMSEKVRSLAEEFEVVLVVERMEESLILLRYLLCWPVERLAHLARNKRLPSKVVKLETGERESLKQWLRADQMIYDHFAKILDDKVKSFNEEHVVPVGYSSMTAMEYEVLQLRQANAKLMETCVIEQVANGELTGKFHEFEYSNSTMGYRVKEEIEDCHPYALSEKTFLNLFREKLNQRAVANDSR